MDSVLYYGLRPIFTGTTEQTVQWLAENPQASELTVRIGDLSVEAYLRVSKHIPSDEKKDDPPTQEDDRR
jgi:hypothetical protein